MIRKVLGVSLLLLASPVFAGDLSYSYVQLGYHIGQQIGPTGEQYDQPELPPRKFIEWMLDGSAAAK